MRGIAPALLAEQVTGTAAWALDAGSPAALVVRGAREIEPRWASDPHDPSYLKLLLAAHYLTVATFVPTDVDTRIRHHHWQGLEGERLAEACAVVDEVASWEPLAVSARVVRIGDAPSDRGLSGHDGEWLAVRAGALGRAFALGEERVAAETLERIEGELAREARTFTALESAPDRALDAMRAATVLAHNAGDLSRVVEAWPDRPAYTSARARFSRLGHDGSDRFGGAFARAGAVNKALMAIENHRFLALRKPRVLRESRKRLLPIGPFFDAWGEDIATDLAGDEVGLASVVEALVSTHLHGPTQLGCLRALAGIHRTNAGGVDALTPLLPARLRKVLRGGPPRDAIRGPRAQFEARVLHRFKSTVPAVPRHAQEAARPGG